MEGISLTNRPRCGLCMYWVGGRCTNTMKAPATANSEYDYCVLFTPFHHVGIVNISLQDFVKTVETAHDGSRIRKPNYKENKPTYESGYLLSKFGKL